ncbi:T9SS type A sorting domain-containing protein, partial [bacterium]|nr:T9SS type A sorting domain-containing protein [bacterium]
DISTGSIICGELWSSLTVRDTDWYHLTLGEPASLLLELMTDNIDAVLLLLHADTGNCYGETIVTLDEVGFCETESVETEILSPGDYLLFLAHNAWQDDISGNYELHVDAEYAIPTFVELITFDIMPASDRVELSWETAGNSSNPYYNVTRDGILLAQLPVEGSVYRYVDFDVQAGSRYNYELQAVTYSGEIEVLSARSITVPTTLELAQNYPNPFNPVTWITFRLASEKMVELTVYNATGERVQDVYNGRLGVGEHVMSFNGSGLPSGTYFYTLQVDGSSLTRKMLLLK